MELVHRITIVFFVFTESVAEWRSSEDGSCNFSAKQSAVWWTVFHNA